MTEKNSNCYQFLSRNGLIISVLAGVAVGFAFGFGLRVLEPSSDAITWIGKLLSCKDHKQTIDRLFPIYKMKRVNSLLDPI